MKTILASFGWLLLLLPLLSLAGTKSIMRYAEGSGADSETRSVSGFNAISSGGPFNVYVSLGSTESLLLEGDTGDLSKIETKVENGTLKIYYKTKGLFNYEFNKQVKVYITAKSLSGLTLNGSGSIKINGTVKSSQLSAHVSGSGSMTFTANVSDFNAVVSGSGKITASGSSEKADIKISGSGQFRGKEFHTSSSYVKVSGSGDIYIAAEKSLDAMVSGSGSIFYSGNPSVKIAKSGSGKVSKI